MLIALSVVAEAGFATTDRDTGTPWAATTGTKEADDRWTAGDGPGQLSVGLGFWVHA